MTDPGELESLRHQLQEADRELARLRKSYMPTARTESLGRCVTSLNYAPEDCVTLLETVLPEIICVMMGGAGSYQPFDWRDNRDAAHHLMHARKHGERADRWGKLPVDHSDGRPERAHQIVRLMMALWHEMRGTK